MMWFDPKGEAVSQATLPATPATPATFPSNSAPKPHGSRESQQVQVHGNDDWNKQVRDWLAHIGEVDELMIDDILTQCEQSQEARHYFCGRAAMELPPDQTQSDDRVCCTTCLNLTGKRCKAVSKGEVVASRQYEPIADLPRRCEGYMPQPGITDRRSGLERWAGLWNWLAEERQRLKEEREKDESKRSAH
jgi:hypothetical protein